MVRIQLCKQISDQTEFGDFVREREMGRNFVTGKIRNAE